MKRRKAREIAVQALYRIEMNRIPAEEAVRLVLEQVQSEEEAEKPEAPDERTYRFIVSLVDGTLSCLDEIDRNLARYLQGWQLDRLSRVDRQILRAAVYEIFRMEEVPPKVAVNEAIELAKRFGGEESGKFVNGVLGKMLREQDRLELTSYTGEEG